MIYLTVINFLLEVSIADYFAEKIIKKATEKPPQPLLYQGLYDIIRLLNISEMAVLFMGYIICENRGQATLFPETIEEYISESNPVRVIDAFVNNLDFLLSRAKHPE